MKRIKAFLAKRFTSKDMIELQNEVHKLADENDRLREAINKASNAMHVDCETGFLCLSDFDFGQLKEALETENDNP